MNTSMPFSSAIVWATQRRNRRGRDTCEYELVGSGGTGLIVTIEEMNLRQGQFNKSCIDFVRTKTRYLTEDEEQCGEITKKNPIHWTTSYTLSIQLYTKTPISYFVDGNILRIIVTSYAEAEEGTCGPSQFLCDNNRCIFSGYQCDGNNNCGDNSDETYFGTSACMMPKSSLILFSLAVINFVVTWCSVFYCCVRSAVSKRKAFQDDRWGMATPPITQAMQGADGHDFSVEGYEAPEMGELLATGPLQTDVRSHTEGDIPFRSPLVGAKSPEQAVEETMHPQ
ncbi:uncharacterized protein LOC135384134 isoform X1 [Ornithodoros turicata]